MKREKVKALLSSEAGREVEVKGWVRTRRGNNNVSFIALNDGSTIKNIQIVVDVAAFDEDLLKGISTGAAIGAIGELVQSQGRIDERINSEALAVLVKELQTSDNEVVRHYPGTSASPGVPE